MKLKYNKKLEAWEEEDYDFDFDRYKKEEKKDTQLKSITDKKPRITGLRSKYSASVETIQLLISVRTNLVEKAISCASRTDDIKELWEFYGCINEAWAIIKDIYGSIIIDEVENKDKEILKYLLYAQKKSFIPDKLYVLLLDYRDKVYLLIQRINLGLEVEKKYGSHYEKAKKGIIE